MANSKFFLGDFNIKSLKLGNSDVKVCLGDTLLYPLSKSIEDAVVTCASATYNGSSQTAQSITVTLSGVTLVEDTDYTVTQNTGGTNAGSYPVVVAGIGNYEGTASGTFTIDKVTPTVTAPTAVTGLVYNASSQALVNAGSTNFGTLKYSLDDSTYTTDVPSGMNATSYTIYYRVDGDSNVNYVAASSIANSIAKVTPTVVAPTAKVLTYNGSAQELVNAGSTNYGTLKYSLNDSTYTTAIPTATNYGSYTVYYKVDGDSNVNSVAAQTVACSINEKQVTATVVLSQTAYTYNGSACQPTVTVKDGTTVIDPSEYTVTYSNNVNAGTATVTISDNVGGNYEVIGSTTFTINKADQSAPTATGATTTYNTTATATASGGGGQGTLTWTNGNTQTTVGSKSTKAYWAGNSNYNASPYSNEVTITMNKATGSVTTAPVNNNYTYNGTARAVASAGSGTGTMYYRLGTSGSFSTTMPTMTNASSSTLYYYAAASTNYEQSSTGSITVSVQKANISPNVSISNWTYGGTASNPSVAGNSGSGTVTYYYKLSSDSSWSATKPSNAGSYNIRADIAATTNYNSGTCTNNFTINKANSSLSFNANRLTVGVGEIKTNVVTVNAGDGTVTYSSNNATAITVDNNGVVTGVNYGGATITATISSTNNYFSASTSYTVTCAAFFTAKFDIIDTTNPTRIASGISNIEEVEFDDGISYTKYALRTGHTFSTTGEHTVKYYLTDPTTIGTSALTKCVRLISVNIPDNITTISGYAFQGCSSLTSVVIPDSVTEIADYNAFDYCTSLTSVTIGSGITSIGTWTFSYCRSLTSITINATTPPTLGSDAFRNTNNCPIYVPTCSLVSAYKERSGWSNYSSRISSLDCYYITTKFNVTTTSSPTIIASATTRFNSIEIDGTPMGVMSAYTFSTTGEHTIKYYLSETTIGGNAFRGCSGLTSIDIPDGVTSIGDNAFIYCSGLTSCTIGSGVTSIGYQVFYGCSSLTSIVCNAVTAPTIQSYTFRNVKSGGTLTVPSGSTGYDVWMGTGNYYLGLYNWTKVEQ